MKNVLALILCLAITISSLAQNRVDIRFSPSHLSVKKSCFDIELRSIENSDILLAGQNYRIFYNPDKLLFNTSELSSYNPKEFYSDARLLKKHHSDEISIAMINLGIDALKFKKSRVTNLAPNSWQATSNVCFSHAENTNYTLTWARADETADLATAYVALSEWKSEKKQLSIHINEYFDYDHSNKESESFQANFSVYPNPVMDKVNLKIDSFGTFEKGTLVIVDASGNQIKKENVNKENTIYQIDMDGLPSGNYFLEISNTEDLSIFQTSFIKSSL